MIGRQWVKPQGPWDSTTKANTCVIRVPAEEREYSAEKIFEEIMAENFLHFVENINLQILNAQ